MVSKPTHILDDGEISVFAIHLDAASSRLLESTLDSMPGFRFTGSLQQYFGEKDATLVRSLRECHPEVCIIDLDSDRQLALDTVEYLRRSASNPLSIFALSSRMDSDSIIAAMRAGCTEYLAKPVQTERLEYALTQLLHKKRDVTTPSLHGKVITLMGVKGGVGTTTLAVHLAYSLASIGQKTLLIDQHPDLGEITLHLGLEHHNYGFYELVSNLNRIDAELVQGFALKHKSGLEVLASPEALGTAAPASAESTLHTLRTLARMYDYVIIDTDCGFSDRNLALLEVTDELCLITQARLPAVRNTSRYLDYLMRLSYPAAKIQVIVNRCTKNSAISIDNIEKILRRKVLLSVPNAESEIDEAIGSGVPIPVKSRSDFMQSIHCWSKQIVGNEKPGAEQRAKGQESRSRFTVLGISG